MPEYLAPGVYVEEVSGGIKPIEGVGTSTAGFLGMTERGPLPPRLVSSFTEYQRWYGGFLPKSYMTYAVKGFFDNGGRRCFIGRIVRDDADPARASINAGEGEESNELNIAALGPGSWGNNIQIMVRKATKSDGANARTKDWVRLMVAYYRDGIPSVNFLSTSTDDLKNPNRREPDVFEDFDNLTHDPKASNNIVKMVNGSSHLIRVWYSDQDKVPEPIATSVIVKEDKVMGTNSWTTIAETSAGGDGATEGAMPTAKHFMGNLDQEVLTGAPLGRGKGLEAFRGVDEIAIVAIPDDVIIDATTLRDSVITHCELLKDRFAVLSVTQDEQNTLISTNVPRDTSYAAFNGPWIYVYDPLTNGSKMIPATGHIAGIYARSDITRGVHKAPANEVVRGAQGLGRLISKGDQDILNPRGVNCIRDFRADGRGIRLWGARTMSSDPEWKYINVRRLFIFVEESIDEGTQWCVFEPNHEPTWTAVRRNVTAFLTSVWRSGGLAGVTQEEAFFVRCDRTTMTEDDINNGRMICLIGIAPVKPAEFVIFRISQKTVEAQV